MKTNTLADIVHKRLTTLAEDFPKGYGAVLHMEADALRDLIRESVNLGDDNVRARLQSIAQAIDERLPKGHGFFLLAFPFNAPPTAQGEYVSNARREDVVAAMKRFVERNPMPPSGNN